MRDKRSSRTNNESQKTHRSDRDQTRVKAQNNNRPTQKQTDSKTNREKRN